MEQCWFSFLSLCLFFKGTPRFLFKREFDWASKAVPAPSTAFSLAPGSCARILAGDGEAASPGTPANAPFRGTQPTPQNLAICELQLEACTATQPGIAGVSFLWFSEHSLPGFASICQDFFGSCCQCLNLLKALLLKDRGHL